MRQKTGEPRASLPFWLLWLIAGIFIILAAGSAWLYLQQQSQLQQETEHYLSAVAQLKANQIVQWRSERLAYPAVISESTFFLDLVQKWIQTRRPEDAQRLLARFRSLQTYYAYWDVLLTDPEGNILLSLSGRKDSFVEGKTAESFSEAMRGMRPVMTDIIPGTGKLPDQVYVITPLAHPSQNPMIPFGTVVLVCNVKNLYSWIQSWPMRSQSAESFLVRREGDSVLFLNELRHRTGTASKESIPLTQTNVPAVMAVLGRKGIVEGLDYRGVEVFAALQPIPETPWFLVAKIDKSEALKEWRSRASLLIGLALSLFLAAAAIAWATYQHSMKVNYRLRLEIEKDRSESIALLNAMGKAAKIGGWELDVETMAGTWTDEMYRIFELPMGQKPFIADAIRLYYHPDEQKKITGAVQRAIEQGESYDLQLRIITAKNRHLWARAICHPVVENGKTKRLLGVFQDITEQKITEEKRGRLEAQLQQAMKMEAVGRLAGGIAHDFNNLLTGITGYTELLIAGVGPDHPMLNDLMEVQKAAQSAVDLARQLLIFSRKQIIEPRVLSLNNLIAHLHKMLVRLIGEDVELKTIPCEPLAAVKVDPWQFELILVNLAINARDAMPEGGRLIIETANVELSETYCTTHPYVQPGSYVMLAVSDTGHGMSKAVMSHLFEPFFTTKPKGRGTGLGLATIYGAVKQAGGSIEVYSEEGKGTAFKIYLPRAAASAETLEKESRLTTDMPGGQETVLLVEDEHIVRELAIKILHRLGYAVHHAQNGDQAMAVAQECKNPIHLLITDVVMPGMNGRQLAEHLIRIHPEMKVLYTSGYTENTIAHHGAIEEDLNFLGKPYSPRDLANKIRKILD